MRFVKHLLCAVHILIFYNAAEAATIYVTNDPNNSGTKVCYKSGSWPDGTCSNGTGNSGIRQALAAAGVGGVTVVAGGEYSGTQIDTGGQTIFTSQTGQTVRGATSAQDSAISGWNIAYANEFILNGLASAYYTVRINHSDFTLSNVTLKKASGGYENVLISNVSGTIIANVKFSTAQTAFVDVNCSSACGTTIKNSTLLGNAYLVRNTAGTQYPTVNIYSTRMTSGQTQNAMAGAVVFDRCDFFGFSGPVLQTTNVTGSVSVKNSRFFANSTLGSNHVIYKNPSHTNATITVDDSLVLLNSWGDSGSYGISAGVTTNNVYSALSPGYSAPRYPSVFIIGVDDTIGLDYFDLVAGKLAKFGYKGYISANHTNSFTQSQINRYQAIMSAGHDVACHTRNHVAMPDIIANSGFIVNKSGVTLSISGGVMTTSDNHSYTLASYNFEQLRNSMIANGVTVNSLGSGSVNGLPASVLGNVTDASINTPYQIAVDSAALYTSEIDGCISDMTAAGISPTLFVPPGNATSTSLRNYLVSRFIGARGQSNDTLSSYNIYNVGVRDSTNAFATGACVAGGRARSNCLKNNLYALFARMEYTGSVYSLYAHSTDELSSADLDDLISVARDSNVNIMGFTDAINFIKTYSPSSDVNCSSGGGDGIVCTRTMVDGSNIAPKSTASIIDLGGSTDVYADAFGNPIFGKPDLGSIEYQPPYIIGTHKINLSGARIYAGNQVGNFRTIADESTITCGIELSPTDGTWPALNASDVRPAWADITAIDCRNVGVVKWTETPIASITEPRHKLTGLLHNKPFRVQLNGSNAGGLIQGSGCVNSICTSNNSGEIIFTTPGSWTAAQSYSVIYQDPKKWH